ncbi:hypothetical protein B1748_29875 [Paenibacillus sp. MY03]|uniref:hypothetical protein n=1 Tax=Paenibacillus sp. MY03 TaxID=302980 RepID=UPI000B3BE259|nr:hypothetical protein [Paenibacillus sp. MY03]OUS69944.1 hypothetical protein B1748_29875 [Paenibacillus sp. MY03]
MRQRKPKMKTWKKVLIWAGSIIVVLGIGGLFAANYVMDKMIAQLSASLEDELLEEVITTPTDAPSGGGDGTVDQPATSEPDGEGSEGQVDSPSSSSGQSNEFNNGVNSGSMNGYSAEISTDKAKDVQDKITVSEKAQLASVFLKQLSMDDIKTLQELAGGGLNQEEKKEARTLILNRLTPEQYDGLIKIAKKYGMSQGRSYEEVSKEQ